MSRYHDAGGRVPSTLARSILRADDTCWICHRPGATTIDHLVPLQLGGTNDPTNLAPAHVGCNSARGTRPLLPPARIAVPGPARRGIE